MIDWKRLIGRVNLDRLTPKVTLRYADHQTGPVVVITRVVCDVTDPSAPPAEVSAVYNLPCVEHELGALNVLCWFVQQNLAHEVAEHFTVDGKRPFDPHRGRR